MIEVRIVVWSTVAAVWTLSESAFSLELNVYDVFIETDYDDVSNTNLIELGLFLSAKSELLSWSAETVI